MAYKIEHKPSFEKDVKSITKKLNDERKMAMAQEVQKVISDPTAGKPLVKNLAGLHNHGFGSKPQYRIIYALHKCPCEVPPEATCTLPLFSDEPAADCDGVLSFLRLMTREDCATFYKSNRKVIEKMLRMDN